MKENEGSAGAAPTTVVSAVHANGTVSAAAAVNKQKKRPPGDRIMAWRRGDPILTSLVIIVQ
jgi:hypothetical protein